MSLERVGNVDWSHGGKLVSRGAKCDHGTVFFGGNGLAFSPGCCPNKLFRFREVSGSTREELDVALEGVASEEYMA